MNSTKVVITGGSGRIGTYLANYLMDNVDVTVIDNKPPKNPDVRFVNANILDFSVLESALENHDGLIHLAGIPNPRMTTPDMTFHTNVQGVWNVLQAAENVGIKRAVVASSDTATGLLYNPPDWGPQYLPVDESHPLRPTDFYSLSKHVTEVICRSFGDRGKLQVIALRPSKVLTQDVVAETQIPTSDISNFHLWAYVEHIDIAQASTLALNISDISYDVFFISAANTLCSRPTLEMMAEKHGKLPEIRKPDIYESNPYASIIDISHAREVLGYEPQSDWRRYT